MLSVSHNWNHLCITITTMSHLPDHEEAKRACEWIHTSPERIQHMLACAAATLTLHEYASTLRSFIMRILKQPSVRVQPYLNVRIPVGRTSTLPLKYLLEDLPRRELLFIFQLIQEE